MQRDPTKHFLSPLSRLLLSIPFDWPPARLTDECSYILPWAPHNAVWQRLAISFYIRGHGDRGQLKKKLSKSYKLRRVRDNIKIWSTVSRARVYNDLHAILASLSLTAFLYQEFLYLAFSQVPHVQYEGGISYDFVFL